MVRGSLALLRFPHPPPLQRRPHLMRLTVQTLHPAHQSRSPPHSDQPNRWCVEGQFQVYSDAKFLTDKGVMTRTLTLERRVLTGSLPSMPEIHNLFTRHRLEWTAHPLGRYSEEVVREFYASYVATLRSQIDRRASPAKQAPLEQVRVRGVQVDISLPAIRRFLYDESADATRIPITAEFDYRW